jgi:C4-dicarboxylate-specific signal transduction histidine kinase
MKIRARIYLSTGLICSTLSATLVAASLQSERVHSYLSRSDAVQGELLFVTDIRAVARARVLEGYESVLDQNMQFAQPKEHWPKKVPNSLLDLESFFDTQGVSQKSENQAAHTEKMRLVVILQTSYAKIDLTVEKALELTRSTHSLKAAQLLGTVKTEFDGTFDPAIRQLLAVEEEAMRKSESGLKESVLRLKVTLTFLTAFALLVALGLGVPLARSIGARLQKLVAAIDEIGRQNFAFRLDGTGTDELSTLARAFNSMADLLTSAREQLTEQQKNIVRTSKMSALGEMASGIAHEINNPVAIILTRAEQLEEILAEKQFDPALLQELTSTIRRTADRIGKIVKGLKSFAREGAEDPFENVGITGVIQDTLELCGDRFKAQGVELRVGAVPADIEISCRPIQISQVVLNLLNNAYDAVESAPTQWVALSVLEVDSMIEISVSDSGGPIPAEVREKIMQPFFTTKVVGKGTGLGLSISKGLVESHGGELFLDEKSPMTRFVVRLPRFNSNRAAA